MRHLAVGAAPLAGTALYGPASRAADPVTAGGLPQQGYIVAGVMPSAAGPGLFLQKGPALYACFVTETPESPALATRYCKPVR